MGVKVFIASIRKSVSPLLTDLPVVVNGADSGDEARKTVPTMGDVISFFRVTEEVVSVDGVVVIGAGADAATAPGWPSLMLIFSVLSSKVFRPFS